LVEKQGGWGDMGFDFDQSHHDSPPRLSPFLESLSVHGIVRQVTPHATVLFHSLPASSHSLEAFFNQDSFFIELSSNLKWDSNFFSFRDLIFSLLDFASLFSSNYVVVALTADHRPITLLQSLRSLGFQHSRRFQSDSHLFFEIDT
jgi:hypothetical protein